VIASLPSYVQAVMGGTTGTAGLVLGIMVIVWTFGSIGSGWLMVHISYRMTAYTGACAIIAGALLLAMLNPQSSVADAVLGVSVLGIGLGFCNTTWIVCVQTAFRITKAAQPPLQLCSCDFWGRHSGPP
jgi:fucose permease